MREQIEHRTGRLPLHTYRVSYVPCHWHDEMEFILPIDAPCHCLIDAQPVTVPVGEALLIHGRQLHTIRCESNFYAIVFHPIGICGQDMLEFFPPNRRFQPRLDNPTTLNTLRAICHTPQAYGYELVLRSHILSIFGHMIGHGHYDIAPNPHPFLQVLTYTQDHACEHGLTLSQIASATFFSSSTISHAFKHYTGMTFSEFVSDCRLNKSCDLLRTTDQSVLDIALLCGFGHVSYFIKCFKKRFGTTPHQYRT